MATTKKKKAVEKAEPETPKMFKAAMEVEIPEKEFNQFFEFLLGTPNFWGHTIFSRYYACWAIPVTVKKFKDNNEVIFRHNDAIVIFAFHDGDYDNFLEYARDNFKEVIKAFKAGQELPDDFYKIDREVALRAYLEGVQLLGWDWTNSEQADGSTYDEVLQLALGGDFVWQHPRTGRRAKSWDE